MGARRRNTDRKTSAISASTLCLGLWMAGLAALLTAGTPVPAHALPLAATPSVSVEQAYDSNVFDDRTGNEKEDFILHIRPAVNFAYPADNAAVNLYLHAETATYYNYSELSRYPESWGAALSSARPILLSPSLSMTPIGYFLDTYDSSRRTQLAFSPSAPTIPIEITQFPRTHTQDYGGSVVLGWQAATQVLTALTGAYNRHEILTDNTGLTDYYTYTGDLAVSYLLGPRSSIGVFGSGSDTTYSNGDESTTYSVGVLGSYTFSEFFRVDARFGESFLRNKPGNGLPESTDQTPTATLTLAYRVRDFYANGVGIVRVLGREQLRRDHPAGERGAVPRGPVRERVVLVSDRVVPVEPEYR